MFTAWKSLAEQQFSALERDEKGPNEVENNQAMMECLKTAASNVYNEFIPDDVSNSNLKYLLTHSLGNVLF